MRHIGKSPDGSILFSTDRALISYDGSTWEIIEEGTDFDAFLSTQENDLVFTMRGNIWKISTDAMGRSTKINLSKEVSPTEWNFLGISKLLENSEGLLAFNGRQMMLIRDDGSHRVYEFDFWAADVFSLNDTIYVAGGSHPFTLYILDLESGELIKAPDEFQHADLWWIHDVWGTDEQCWIVGDEGRIFLLDETGIHPWYQSSEETSIEGQINCILTNRDDYIVVGTQDHGVYVYHKDGRLLQRITQENGLLFNRVTHMYADETNGLWVPQKGNLQYLIMDRQTLAYGSPLGLEGEVLSIQKFQKKIYVGTGSGLFSLEEEKAGFTKIATLSRVSWMDISRGKLLFIHENGIGSFDGQQIEWIDTSLVEFAFLSKKHPDWLFYENNQSTIGVRWTDGKWSDPIPIAPDAGRPLGFGEDGNGWVWSIISAGKCLRFKPNANNEIVAEQISLAEGLPEVWAQPFIIEGNCYLGNNPVKKWNEKIRRFEHTDDFKYYDGWIPFGYEHVFSSEDGNVWVAKGKNVGNLVKRPHRETIAAIVIDGKNIDTRSNAIFRENDELVWIGGVNSLIRYEKLGSLHSDEELSEISIKRIVSLRDDSVIFSGTEYPETLELDYSQRSIRVEASLKNYRSCGFIRFSLGLTGFKEESTGWEYTNAWDFTNLVPGKYELTISGHDATGMPATPAVLPFRVSPPIYATIQAYSLYVIVSAIFILILLKLRTRHLTLLNRNLEEAVLSRTELVTKQRNLLEQQNEELNKAKDESDRLAQQAKIAAKSKSRFLANMSHEIRTPMNGVIGMCELLSETTLTSEQREYVSTIERSGENLLAIINDILNFSKIDAGRMQMESISFDLRKLVGEILSLLTTDAYKKRLEVVCDFDPSISSMHIGDPVRIQQVLINLLGNAIKFTPEGEVRLIIRPSQKFKEGIVFTIEDTGVGISEDQTKDLFSPFTQMDSSITRRFGGTGLGLAISHKLVQLMEGTISCERISGGGSRFTFEIPFKTDSSIRNRPQVFGYKKVYWFDKNQSRRESIQRFMDYMKIDSHISDSISSLSSICQDLTRDDMIWIDSWLLGKSDEETEELLQKIDQKSKIILLTEHSENKIRVLKQLENVEIVYKPLKCQNLSEALGGSLQQIDQISERAEKDKKFRLPELSNFKVMVVEDNRINQRLATFTLAKFGITPDLFNDGLEATQAVRQKNYHLILMDVQMPNMGGFEATQKIRDFQELGSFKSMIFALTAGVADFKKEQYFSAGMDGYLAKPFKQSQLMNVVQKAYHRFFD